MKVRVSPIDRSIWTCREKQSKEVDRFCSSASWDPCVPEALLFICVDSCGVALANDRSRR
jgi:hypothetical protein